MGLDSISPLFFCPLVIGHQTITKSVFSKPTWASFAGPAYTCGYGRPLITASSSSPRGAIAHGRSPCKTLHSSLDREE